jgi:asparagine synthetase B (glutamine-hydrolysing)
MPGITGLHAPGAAPADLPARLRGMERELYPAPGLRREESGDSGETGFACAVHTRLAGAGVLERRGARLAFDGYVTDRAPRGRELLGWLLDGFLERGPAFLEGLDGSFQAAVHHRGATWLFADPTASRRLFYAAGEEGLWFSPEVGPLARLPAFAGGDRIEPANLVQFLLSGRFFAGRTLLPWVRKLLPGESLVWRAGRLERRRHFRYEVTHPEADRPGLLEELGELLERAVLRAWEQADAPVIPLSGGYDSRYIFNTLARHAEVPKPRWTVLWGERMDLPGSDSAIAREVARRGGAQHITLPWRTEALPEQFEEMFLAQSGMTELIFTHSDELAIFRSLAGRGFRTVLRGDECFGPKGEEVSCVPGALSRVAMSRAADVPESRRWLSRGGEAWLAATRR